MNVTVASAVRRRPPRVSRGRPRQPPPSRSGPSDIDLANPLAPMSTARVQALQRTAGNAAVTRLLTQRANGPLRLQRDTPFGGLGNRSNPFGFGQPRIRGLRRRAGRRSGHHPTKVGDIRPGVSDKLGGWYERELTTAVGLTPQAASPILDPRVLQSVLTTHHGGSAPLGRWGAEVRPGQTIDVFKITDIGHGLIWFHRPDRPLWMYVITEGDFIKFHDPFVASVTEKVYESTKWIRQITPLLLKIGAFALGFSGSIALVIAGIALDEFATEMQADVEGGPRRDLTTILGSAGTQLLVDRVFHGLFGGAAGKAAAGAGKNAAKIERVAERAMPVIRKQLAEAEAPLVKQALEARSARKVTDAALQREGYLVEVAVDSGGQKHIFRLHQKGTWCRFSSRICQLDLGSDVAAAARSPKSFTQGKIDTLRENLTRAQDESEFLRALHTRMKPGGKVDLSLRCAPGRRALRPVAPSSAERTGAMPSPAWYHAPGPSQSTTWCP